MSENMECFKPQKMKWPITKHYQEIFRQQSDWSELIHLIPEYNPDIICGHGYRFESRCPKQMGWVQSDSVKLYGLEYSKYWNIPEKNIIFSPCRRK